MANNPRDERGHAPPRQSSIRLHLTPEQQAQVFKATGRDASTLELSVHEIEESLDLAEDESLDSESGF